MGTRKIAKAAKDIDGDCGVFHRGHGGRRAAGVNARKRAIERRVRRDGRRACEEGRADA